MPVTMETYERLALEDPDSRWELVGGTVERKPGITTGHNDVIDALQFTLMQQLPRSEWVIRPGTSRVQIPNGNVRIPDLFVVARTVKMTRRRDNLEVYVEPLPLIVEVWSPSTGREDRVSKVPEYQARGDLEIWLLHPFRQRLTAHRRHPDGTYAEQVLTSGMITPVALPDVTIDIAALFAER